MSIARLAPLPVLLLHAATLLAAGCELPAVGGDGSRIVGGEDHTGDPAVVLVDLGPAGGYCTGTLVSPKVVLTAAHCLHTPGNIKIRFVTDADATGPAYPVIAETAAERGDIALLSIAQSISAVAPIPFYTQSLRGTEGRQVRLVGFGATSETSTDFGVKRAGASKLAKLGEVKADEMATTNNPQGTCYGDSGGPNFMTIEGTEYVVAVTSRGTDECGAGFDVAVRTDAHVAFIYGFIREHDPVGCQAMAGCTVDPEQVAAAMRRGGGGCSAATGAAPGGSGGLAAGLAALGLLVGAGRRRRRRGAAVAPLALLALALGALPALVPLAGCDSGGSMPATAPAPAEPTPPPMPAPGGATPRNAPPAAAQPPYRVNADGYIHLNEEANLRARAALAIVRKPRRALNPMERETLDAWKEEIRALIIAHIDSELTSRFGERYTSATEERRDAMRTEYVRSAPGLELLNGRATTVRTELYSNRVAANLPFEAELMFNAMYLAMRKRIFAPGREPPPPPRPVPGDHVDDVVSRCGKRLGVDFSHYR